MLNIAPVNACTAGWSKKQQRIHDSCNKILFAYFKLLLAELLYPKTVVFLCPEILNQKLWNTKKQKQHQ